MGVQEYFKNLEINEVFHTSCVFGDFEKIKTILASQDENFDIHAKKDQAFIDLCRPVSTISQGNKLYIVDYIDEQKTKIIKFLILDFKLELTDPIREFLKNNPGHIANQFFSKRELNEKLLVSLKVNNPQEKINKI